MKYVVVTDCASSGQMYVDDIIGMGYRPLLIYTPVDAEHAAGWAANIETVKKGIGDRADYLSMITEESYDNIRKALSGYDVVCAVAGSEPGVRLADRITGALGLKGNNPETTYLRCTKAGMDEALTKAGLRHINTTLVRNEEDVRAFWNSNKLTKAVMKFSESGGTVGLKICDTCEECVDHFKAMGSMYSSSGKGNVPVVMQEFVGGTEYIVNSLSVDGKHKITDVWRYEKIIQDDGVLVYDTCILVDRLGPGMQELIQYDYKVLDAVDMKNGFSHNEFKIDGKGPILIETNARPMGANLTSEYLDEIFGYHMTDITLKALLEPTFFPNFVFAPYIPRKSAMFKFSIVPRDTKADLSPFFELVRHLESYREINYFGDAGVQEYVRTIDLETSPFFIKLINADYGALKRDYELLRNMEERYFDMVFPEEVGVDAMPLSTDIGRIIASLPLARRFAVIEDDKTTVHQYGKATVSNDWEVFDGVVFARCGKTTLTERFRQMMKAMSQTRKGGPVILIPESYRALPHGMVGAEVLMAIMGVTPEIPPSMSNGILYGIKR